jgi:hypothetical protein
MCLDHPVFGHLPRVLTAFEHSVPLFDAPATKSVQKGPSVGSNLPSPLAPPISPCITLSGHQRSPQTHAGDDRSMAQGGGRLRRLS